MHNSVPTTGFISTDHRNPAGYTIRLTLAAPARPTSSSTWPTSRRSAPTTGAKISLGLATRADAPRFGAFLRTAFRGATFRAANFRVAFFAVRARAAPFVTELREVGRVIRFLAMCPRKQGRSSRARDRDG